MSKKFAISIASMLWFGVGVMLLVRGFHMIQVLESDIGQGPLLRFITTIHDSVRDNLWMMVGVGVILGLVKGNTVLRMVALKNFRRINDAKKISIWEIYPLSSWLVIVFMMGMGMMMKQLMVPIDIRAVVCIGVGTGLIQGSIVYFRLIPEIEKSA